MFDDIELRLISLGLNVDRRHSGSNESIHATNETGSVEISLTGRNSLWIEFWKSSIPEGDDPPAEEIAADDLDNLVLKIKSWLKC